MLQVNYNNGHSFLLVVTGQYTGVQYNLKCTVSAPADKCVPHQNT